MNNEFRCTYKGDIEKVEKKLGFLFPISIIENLEDELINLFHELHKYPELSNEEFKTTEKIKKLYCANMTIGTEHNLWYTTIDSIGRKEEKRG